MADAQLDDIDHALIAAVQRDARATLGELAQQIQLGVSATRVRLHGLQTRRVITGYRADIDPAALGYALRAVVRMKVHGALYDKVGAFLAEEPQILRCLRVTGDACYLMEIVAVDMADLARITSALAGIGSLTTDLVYEVVVGEATVMPPRPRHNRAQAAW